MSLDFKFFYTENQEISLQDRNKLLQSNIEFLTKVKSNISKNLDGISIKRELIKSILSKNVPIIVNNKNILSEISNISALDENFMKLIEENLNNISSITFKKIDGQIIFKPQDKSNKYTEIKNLQNEINELKRKFEQFKSNNNKDIKDCSFIIDNIILLNTNFESYQKALKSINARKYLFFDYKAVEELYFNNVKTIYNMKNHKPSFIFHPIKYLYFSHFKEELLEIFSYIDTILEQIKILGKEVSKYKYNGLYDDLRVEYKTENLLSKIEESQFSLKKVHYIFQIDEVKKSLIKEIDKIKIILQDEEITFNNELSILNTNLNKENDIYNTIDDNNQKYNQILIIINALVNKYKENEYKSLKDSVALIDKELSYDSKCLKITTFKNKKDKENFEKYIQKINRRNQNANYVYNNVNFKNNDNFRRDDDFEWFYFYLMLNNVNNIDLSANANNGNNDAINLSSSFTPECSMLLAGAEQLPFEALLPQTGQSTENINRQFNCLFIL